MRLSFAGLKNRIDAVGFEGTRRALAALSLAFFMTLYFLVALNGPPGWGTAFLMLALCYAVGSVAVGAEWFWGRWFAAGLGWSGVMVGVASLVMTGWNPILAVYGGAHGIVVVALTGAKMSARYELQENWRKRWSMDEYGVARLGKTITRAAASLPSLILWALGPKEGDGSALLAGPIALVLAGATVASLAAVIRLRTAGVLGLAATAVGLLVLGGGLDTQSVSAAGGLSALAGQATAFNGWDITPNVAAVLLGLAVVPFLGPALAFLRRR